MDDLHASVTRCTVPDPARRKGDPSKTAASPPRAGRGNHLGTAGGTGQCSPESADAVAQGREAHPLGAAMDHAPNWRDSEAEGLEHHQSPRLPHPGLWIQAAQAIPPNTGTTTGLVSGSVQLDGAVAVCQVRAAGETQEHLFDCADHAATHECFRERHRTLQQGPDTWIDTGALRPWTSLGWLQGHVDPYWETVIAWLQHGARRRAPSETVMQELLCASLETWYHAIWLPRCQRTTSQERDQGLHQGAKLGWMRAATQDGTHAPPLPTPSLPPSSLHSSEDRRNAHHRIISQRTRGTGVR